MEIHHLSMIHLQVCHVKNIWNGLNIKVRCINVPLVLFRFFLITQFFNSRRMTRKDPGEREKEIWETGVMIRIEKIQRNHVGDAKNYTRPERSLPNLGSCACLP